jgi:mannose-1-phosphate guanylyltransferase/mannose-1-phosphate guanylyltransferase/mannose-6-phosphate isomerase
MLQETALRAADPALFDPPMLVLGEEHAATSLAQLAEAGVTPCLMLLEPCPRGTAGAIALAALNAQPDQLLLVMPSDHVVGDTGAFGAAIAAGRPLAEDGWLVTFGVTPDRPETGYGYIRQGEPLGGGAVRAAAFVEKPPRELAERYFEAGNYFWNAGIFLFRADALLAALETHAPEVFTAARAAVERQKVEGDAARPDAEAFAAAPSAAIDRAVMEKSDHVAVVPADMAWSDIGSWEALWALGPRDGAGNVLSGDVVAPSSTGCLIRSDGPTLVALGVHDLVVVATERAVLVVPRGESQRVKEAIDALQAREQKPPRP